MSPACPICHAAVRWLEISGDRDTDDTLTADTHLDKALQPGTTIWIQPPDSWAQYRLSEYNTCYLPKHSRQITNYFGGSRKRHWMQFCLLCCQAFSTARSPGVSVVRQHHAMCVTVPGRAVRRAVCYSVLSVWSMLPHNDTILTAAHVLPGAGGAGRVPWLVLLRSSLTSRHSVMLAVIPPPLRCPAPLSFHSRANTALQITAQGEYREAHLFSGP